MFAPGDLVVCVDDTPAENAPDYGPMRCIAQGKHYRVNAVWFWRESHVVSLVGVSAETNSGGYGVRRFRKIEPASDSFTEQMRACKPRFDRCRTPLVLANGEQG